MEELLHNPRPSTIFVREFATRLYGTEEGLSNTSHNIEINIHKKMPEMVAERTGLRCKGLCIIKVDHQYEAPKG